MYDILDRKFTSIHLHLLRKLVKRKYIHYFLKIKLLLVPVSLTLRVVYCQVSFIKTDNIV